MRQFPIPEMAERVLNEYYIPGGKAVSQPFKTIPMPTLQPRPALVELTVLGNYVEVFLAKEGHEGLVGINFLEKIQLPTLPSIYGAMLADVDYVLMGAGIPRSIPGILDRFAEGQATELRVDVSGAGTANVFSTKFDPQSFFGGKAPRLKRPLFLGIIASSTLALTLARKSSGRVDGFIVEGPTAGGHNAPPRGTLQLNAAGEPTYGVRDVVDLEKIREIGLPFWLAGSFGRPGKLAEALALGAAGIQVGTAFAFCKESGMASDLKDRALALSAAGKVQVFTDPLASPTGFPFKVAQFEGTASDPIALAKRPRVCDLGYLRQLYLKKDGTVGYRCPAEPEQAFALKGGNPEETKGRKCICNGLPANVGIGQVRKDGRELPIVTAGDDLVSISQFLEDGRVEYTAEDVLRALLREEVVKVGS